MIESLLPFWKDLTEDEKDKISKTAVLKKYETGSFISPSFSQCLGFIAVESGIIRAYITSETGREITLYTLSKGEICLFSAKCAFKDLSFTIQLEVKETCEIYIITSSVYEYVIQNNTRAASFTNELMAKRFSEVMSLLSEILFKGFDERLKEYLKNKCLEAKSNTIHITHEEIAMDLGSAREVVSRMLSHLAIEGIVSVKRGYVTLLKQN